MHEAARQDQSGVVYLTEDNGDPADGFYRFVPTDKLDLAKGGRLQMLAVKDQPQLETYTGQNRRRWNTRPNGSTLQTPTLQMPRAIRPRCSSKGSRWGAHNSWG